MVGCSLTSTSDHTFAALKIWGDVAGAETIHTINVESVEIASAVIVPSTKAHDFSHAAEQFSRRYNVRPKCHITEGDTLWKALFGDGVFHRLGLFHCVNRIRRTLRIDHTHYGTGTTSFQERRYTKTSQIVSEKLKFNNTRTIFS